MAKLFYVMGASGAGKDSILDYARHHLAEDSSVLFAHRYITRPADAGGENHRALSESEFMLRSQANCFAMQWHSHGLHYAVGKEVDDWLARGLSVVVNGSRQYLAEALVLYPFINPVLIQVDNDKLAERLLKRGRETAKEINERLLKRENETLVTHPNLITIDNNKTIDDSGKQFLNEIYRLTAPKHRALTS